MQGTVVKSSGSVYGVRATDGTLVDCRVKGNFRLKGIRSTNPVAVGDNVIFDMREDGTAYIVVCDSAGFMYLIDGTTGNRLYSMSLGYLIEASPAIYENTIVIGTRGQKIWAIDIK